MKRASLIFFLLAVLVATQPVVAQSFPDNAMAPNADELKRQLNDKVFKVMLADGKSWRLQFKTDGYFFINTSTGFSDSGKWKIEDGKLCTDGKKIEASCNEVRIKGEDIYYQRSNGEVVKFLPQ